MDQGQVLQLMLQYLKENHLDEARKALEDETGLKYFPAGIKGSALQTILDEHEERRVAEIVEADGAEMEDPLRELPDEAHATELSATHESLHQANVVAVKFSPHDPHLLASGGAASRVVLSDLEGNVSRTLDTGGSGALMSLDFHPKDPRWLLSSYMDGSHAISDVTNGGLVQHFKDHQKFVTKVAWSACGSMFASCSHDCTVKIYKPAEQGEWAVAATHSFSGIAETMCFGEGALVVSVRDDHRLHYIDLATGQNTSNIENDTHLWCSVLDLSLSPCGGYLLLCTDKNKNVVMPFKGPAKHVRCLYGAVNDQLSTPRAVWSPQGRNVYCTSQDYSVMVWDVSNQEVLGQLKGHTKTVRAIDHHPTKSMLASCSFDKSVRLWI